MPAEHRASLEYGEAVALATAILEGAGMPHAHAARTGWALATAEAWGRGSHGLMRLGFYVPRLIEGGTASQAELRIVRDSGAVVSFDGGNGLGHWQCWSAAEEAARRARIHGIAAVSVSNSGHNGALGLYVLPILAEGFVGLVFSNGPAVMPPAGGHAPLLSTSPIAAGIPTRPRPTIIDLATSAVARGRVAQAAAAGEEIPEGWGFDREGRPTSDASVALAGMLAPMAGPKGYALALLVESLTGAIVGPSLAGDIGDPLSHATAAVAQRCAHLIIAIDPGTTDGDGRSAERLALLSERVDAAGGRLPGSTNPIGSDLTDELVLGLSPQLVDVLVGLARRFSIAVPNRLEIDADEEVRS